MTEFSIKRNRIKAAGTILTAMILGLLVLSPTTILPNVTAVAAYSQTDRLQTMNSAQQSSMFSKNMPAIARQMQLDVDDQVATHKGWIGHLFWNATGGHIMYLGPETSDPYRISDVGKIGGHPFAPKNSMTVQGSSQMAPISPLTTLFVGLKEGDGITQDCTSGSTSEFEETVLFNIAQSTDANVNNFQILNAMNSDNSRWLQVGTVYNNTGDKQWHAAFNSWNTGTGANEVATAPPISLNNGNQVQNSIQDDPFNPGQYVLKVSQQASPFNSVSTTIHPSGDKGFKINLGEVSNTAGIFPSAGMVEQNTAVNGEGWNFGTETFNPYTLTDTFGGTVTQCVNGWIGQVGNGGAHVTSTSNNPAQDTFAYGP